VIERPKILIVNDTADCGFPYGPLFAKHGDICEDPSVIKTKPETISLVVFTGGCDVHPSLYNDTSPNNVCMSNKNRDDEEASIYRHALWSRIPAIGICRGMQLLNVLNGGRLLHHISGHTSGEHEIRTRKSTPAPMISNSFHHQMCIPHRNTHIIAWTKNKLSDIYVGDKDEEIDYSGPEVEAIFCPLTRCAGVQWHPEHRSTHTDVKTWFHSLVHSLLYNSIVQIEKEFVGSVITELKIEYEL
jgi:putative glutamine amidotransferase